MKPITLNEALVDYASNRLGNLGKNTRLAHDGQLERWRVWVTRETQPYVYLEAIDHSLMSRYFAKLRPPAHEESTFNNYRQYVKAFWVYCVGESWVRTNPMRYVDALKVPQKQRLRLSAGELLEMLERAANPRDRAFLAVGQNTLLRAGDLKTLTVGDANLRNRVMSAYIQKTKKTDEIPILKNLRAELLRWYEVYAEMSGFDSVSQLPNSYILLPPFAGRAKKGGGMVTVPKPFEEYSHPERIVQSVLEVMGFPTYQQGFHTMRRSSARVMHDQLAAEGIPNPIRIIQSLLGHQTQKVTEIYLGLDADRQRRDELMVDRDLLGDAADRERSEAAVLDAEAFNPGARLGTMNQRRKHA